MLPLTMEWKGPEKLVQPIDLSLVEVSTSYTLEIMIAFGESSNLWEEAALAIES